jgi:hypothetical protein
MTFHKILSFLKKALIGYCFLIIILNIIDIFKYPFAELYHSISNRITVCVYLIAILTVKKRAMWMFGLVYFIIGTIDLFFYSVEYRIPSILVSGAAVFDLTFDYDIFSGLESHLAWNIHFYIRLIMMFSFPFTALLFFTNPARKHYGLPPIFKFKN